MYMRLVELNLKPQASATIRQVYAETIMPALQRTQGCLFASLIQSVSHPNESLSLTLWDTLEHAQAYERSGLFQELLNQIEQYSQESSEWRVQLSKELTLEYAPVREEPVVRSYQIRTSAGNRMLNPDQFRPLHLRIVSAKLQPGKREEFENLYNTLILPTLCTVRGCRYAFLTENIEAQDEAISVTIWDSKEDAEAYERSGTFDRLVKKVRHTFSELYQWKMSVEKQSSLRVSTSDDLEVRRYTVVTGKSFE